MFPEQTKIDDATAVDAYPIGYNIIIVYSNFKPYVNLTIFKQHSMGYSACNNTRLVNIFR